MRMSEQETFRPGDRVRVELGMHTVAAEVLETHGRAGDAGDRILRIGWTPTESDERVEIDVPASRVAHEGTSFESQVQGILERSGAEVSRLGTAGAGTPDFLVSLPGKHLVVGANPFADGVTRSSLNDAERRLRLAKAEHDASDAVLVLPKWDRLLALRGGEPRVSVVTVGQLHDWLRSHAA